MSSAKEGRFETAHLEIRRLENRRSLFRINALWSSSIVLFPRRRARPRGLSLLLHGTGGDENDMIPLGRDLDPTAALLSPRGNVLENGMPRFFRRLAEGIFDEEDVIRRAHELADFVGAAAARYEFDPKHVTAVGYSNGANIAAAILLLRPEVLAGAVLFRAMVPLVPPVLPKSGSCARFAFIRQTGSDCAGGKCRAARRDAAGGGSERDVALRTRRTCSRPWATSRPRKSG